MSENSKKIISTSFWVHPALESWSKYTSVLASFSFNEKIQRIYIFSRGLNYNLRQHTKKLLTVKRLDPDIFSNINREAFYRI